MKRVLFVDDEPNILQGLKRMMHRMRGEWEMHFAQSGPAGLELLQQQPFDIVVSDMQMPGMDGADFLTKVKESHPDTVRIILSGHSGKEAIMKSIGPTHQYLSKPCEPEVLQATIQRTYALRELLQSEHLQALVADLESLPSLPALYREIVAEVQNPNSSLERIGAIIRRDLGMSAKILKVVNSAYFGLRRPIHSVEHAVTYLGLETVTDLVLAMQVFAEFDSTAVPGFSLEALWRHSVDTATAARVIARAEEVDKTLADSAFTAGLLHDVGTLLLAANVPERFNEVWRMAAAGTDRLQAEREVLRATHGEVGAYLIGLWGLPDPIIEAVAHHSNPAEAPGAGFSATAIVHAADALVAQLASAASGKEPDLAYLERVGKAARVEAWREACAEALLRPAQ
jgi:HD-like signal output (HDOD) protein